MTVEAFMIQNFMSFENGDIGDDSWIELAPITLLFGRNSSGKSAILRALLLLEQSMTKNEQDTPLLFVADDGFDFGNFHELVYQHNAESNISFWFRLGFSIPYDSGTAGSDEFLTSLIELKLVTVDSNPDQVSVKLKVRLIYGIINKQLGVCGLDVYDQDDNPIISATPDTDYEMGWRFENTTYINPYDDEWSKYWESIGMFCIDGFWPVIRDANKQNPRPYWDVVNNGKLKEVGIFLERLGSEIKTCLAGLRYLAPLRPKPTRYYDVRGQSSSRLPGRNQNMIRLLLQAQLSDTGRKHLDAMNEWLAKRELGLRLCLRAQELSDGKAIYELQVADTDKKEPFWVNLCDVGSGISQILPVVLEAFLAPNNSVILIEQPELHLHPEAQAKLGDLFIYAAMKHNVRFLIETHSEHLLLRLQRRIAETMANTMPEDSKIFANDVKLYFVEKLGGKSVLQPIILDQLGELEKRKLPAGFRSFFADDMKEYAALTDAIMKAEK